MYLDCSRWEKEEADKCKAHGLPLKYDSPVREKREV